MSGECIVGKQAVTGVMSGDCMVDKPTVLLVL